jgi:hypothetical protein
MHFDPSQTLAAAEAELDALTRARSELDRRISGLRLVIQGLRQISGLSAADGPEPEGLTASCRAILRSATQALSPAEVKGQLDAMRFDWSSYSSPLSAVHTVLKRLVARGQAVATESDGKTRYCWKQVRVVVARREDIHDPERLDELIQKIRKQGEEDK